MENENKNKKLSELNFATRREFYADKEAIDSLSIKGVPPMQCFLFEEADYKDCYKFSSMTGGNIVWSYVLKLYVVGIHDIAALYDKENGEYKKESIKNNKKLRDIIYIGCPEFYADRGAANRLYIDGVPPLKYFFFDDFVECHKFCNITGCDNNITYSHVVKLYVVGIHDRELLKD